MKRGVRLANQSAADQQGRNQRAQSEQSNGHRFSDDRQLNVINIEVVGVLVRFLGKLKPEPGQLFRRPAAGVDIDRERSGVAG